MRSSDFLKSKEVLSTPFTFIINNEGGAEKSNFLFLKGVFGMDVGNIQVVDGVNIKCENITTKTGLNCVPKIGFTEVSFKEPTVVPENFRFKIQVSDSDGNMVTRGGLENQEPEETKHCVFSHDAVYMVDGMTGILITTLPANTSITVKLYAALSNDIKWR